MTITLDINMGLILFAVFMLITNAVTVYFTFRTWYGKKKKKEMVAYTIDENGKYHFDMDDEK
tara:strand:+ start:187 stop:372 length:186 start_codon:yes stop_codon:yes gene_type:complete